MRDALIIVDMQKAFVNTNTVHLPEKITNFAKNGNFAAIVGTKYVNHDKTPCYVFEGWKKCMRGSGEEDLLPEIFELCDIVLSKDKYTCWNEQLTKFLQKLSIDRVVFVGVNTGCCVLHSAFDSYNNLFETIVVSDLCGSTSGKESHEAAIKILSECITKERVITSKEYLKIALQTDMEPDIDK